MRPARWPTLALFVLVGAALGFGAWTGFPVHGDAIVPLLEHEFGGNMLAAKHTDRPLYGWMLQASASTFGLHRLAWVAIGLALWGLLAWQSSRLFQRLFPNRPEWSWLPALLVLSPIVVQTQFATLTMVYACVAPVALALAALLAGSPAAGSRMGWRRSLAVLLLAGLAAVVSEYGVAAAFAGVALALVLRYHWTAVRLGVGAACGALVFALTTDSSVRPDVTATAQLPKLLSAPLRALYRWLSGIWYSTVGAYGGAAWRVEIDPESYSTAAVAAAGVLGAVLAALAARADPGIEPGRSEPRRFAGLLLAVSVAILPVVAAGRPAAFHGASAGEYDTRYLLPALPFACVMLSGLLAAGVTRSMTAAAAALFGFLCVEETWRGAFQSMRSQRWAEELGRALLPIVRDGEGIIVAVGADDPRLRWGPILTGKMTLSWPAEDARRVWALPESRAVHLIGTRERCRLPDAIRLGGETRWTERSGPLVSAVWVPDAGDHVGPLEPYCLGSRSP